MRILSQLLVALFLITAVSGCVTTDGKSKSAKQAEIRHMGNRVLNKLYASKPYTREQVSDAAGYGVFSNANINLLIVSAGGGYGLLKNNNELGYTYMKMAEGGVGLGFGVKDYRVVMIFHTVDALNHFKENGWTFGGNADAAAKANKMGASVESENYYGDVSVYTITENGLALQATIKGTKFWVDKDLN